MVVSMGAMGAMYVSEARTLYAPALRVEARSTVGAGDAMVGGMLLGLQKSGDMAQAFRYGIAAGAASVMTEGTQLIHPEDFEPGIPSESTGSVRPCCLPDSVPNFPTGWWT